MRVIVMGTPAFSVPVLEAVAAAHEVVAVYTRAPKPGGRRGLDATPSPVHAAAQRLGLPIETPKTLRGADAAPRLAAYGADVAVVVAYGLILPPAILAVPPRGCLNLHASLLPRWRGAAPIQRAIMAGDTETGVMVMRMEEGLDTGPVALTDSLSIPPDMTAGALHDALAPRGAALMVKALAALADGTLVFTPQAETGVTYAHKIEKAEARIDWRDEAASLHNRIRGLSPFPGAFFEADLGRGPERVKVLRTAPAVGSGPPGQVLDAALTVACGTGALRLVEVQRAGKPALDATAFLRGTPIAPGTLLARPA